MYVFSYFRFGFEGRIWDLIVSVPDHCLSFLLYNVIKLLNWPDFCHFLYDSEKNVPCNFVLFNAS